jgi:hypothetical protein
MISSEMEAALDATPVDVHVLKRIRAALTGKEEIEDQ